MLTSLGHEVLGVLPFPLPEGTEERQTAARMAVDADVCVIDPGAADLAELREGLRVLEGDATVSRPIVITRQERTGTYITAHRRFSEQGAIGTMDATRDYAPPRNEPCRFVVLTTEEHRSADNLRSLLEARIQGVVSKRRSAAEIVDALTLVHRGGIYFDPDMVRRALISGTARTRPYSAELLTQRELEVLGWLAHGAATGEMATAMSISTATVRSHIKAAMSKLGVSSRLQAAARAISLGLVDPPPGC